MKLAETQPFTIESFYKNVSEGKLMTAKCSKCEKVSLPPKPICTNCFSREFAWITLKGKGKLLSYTTIHVAPLAFQSMAPYTVGIVELEEGMRLPGMIRGIEPEKIKVGMTLHLDFDTATSSEWPHWPRYFFRPH